MARIPGPQDVPLAPVSNTRRIVQVATDQSGATLARVGAATTAILSHARDQQIENQVADAEMRTRKQLDDLNVEIAKGDDPGTYEQTYSDRARQIVDENTANLTSPAHQRIWRESMNPVLERGRQQVAQFAQTRTVEQARAGLLDTLGTAQTTIINPDASPKARTDAMTGIETMVARAVARHTITADSGQQIINAARANVAEFEHTQGLRVQAQQQEDQIWAASDGNLEVALEHARDLPGILRDEVTTRILNRNRQNDEVRQEAERGAMERAMSLLESGGTLASLSAGDRATLTRAGQMDNLRAYSEHRATTGSGATAAESEALADALEASAVENPDAFQDEDLAQYRTRLTADDYRRVLERQRAGAQNSPVETGFRTMWAEAQSAASGVGISVSARAEDADTTQALRGFIYNQARAFAATNHRAPRASERQEIIDLALTQARAGFSRRRVFEFSARHVGVRVRLEQIPSTDRERIVRALVRRNPAVTPTRDQVEAAYQDEIGGP